MSHPYYDEEQATEEHAIAVRIIGAQASGNIEDIRGVTAPEFSTWSAWALKGTENNSASGTGCIQLLKQEMKRKRAVITIGGAFPTGTPTAGMVMIGDQNRVKNFNPAVPVPLAGILYAGMSITIEGQSEVWVAADGTNPLTVTVLDERYQ
jgi:hypothetical protein